VRLERGHHLPHERVERRHRPRGPLGLDRTLHRPQRDEAGLQITNPTLRDSDGDKLDDFHEVPHEEAGVEVCVSISSPASRTRCSDVRTR